MNWRLAILAAVIYPAIVVGAWALDYQFGSPIEDIIFWTIVALLVFTVPFIIPRIRV